MYSRQKGELLIRTWEWKGQKIVCIVPLKDLSKDGNRILLTILCNPGKSYYKYAVSMYSCNLTECLRNFFSYWFSWLHRLINIHLHETLTPEIESIFNVKGLRLKFSVNHLKWNTIYSLWPNSSTEIISWISIQEQSNTIDTSVSSTWVSI